MLSRVPVFKMLEGERVRQGFVSPADFTRLLGFIPSIFAPSPNGFIVAAGENRRRSTLSGKRST